MSSGAMIVLARRSVRMVLAALFVAVLGACGTYVPEGSLVVSVKNSKREFERGELMPARNELGDNRIIKMKWYDTNTFLTSGSLTPGIYSFRARNYEGAAFQQEIKIVPGKDLYELDAQAKGQTAGDVEVVAGPKVSGKVQGYTPGRRAGSVSVLFIGTDIVMRSTNLANDGSFTVDAPRKGQWKIEVHMLGQVPRSYVHPVTNVTGPLNLGPVALK